MSTHPAEVNEALDRARNRCLKLIRDAEKRGDQAGADAWLVALRSIESTERAMRDAREAQTWRDSPPTSPLIMPCGCQFGSHPAKQNYLTGAADREGLVCDLGWPTEPSSVRQHEAPESPETDQAHAVDLAKRIAGRSGSKWHDIDQRLARSVIRTCNERDSEHAKATEALKRLHDARRELEEDEAFFAIANWTRDFLDKLLAGLGTLLPNATPRTVDGIVSAIHQLRNRLMDAEAALASCGRGPIAGGPSLLVYSHAPISKAPVDAVSMIVAGSSSIFEVTSVASRMARNHHRPIAFVFSGSVVVVTPSDDPDVVARAWWSKAYG